tara:strand:- start:86 stop:511 length:426 start_codon:yes stop_codon:yes gene_type:complete
MIRNLRPFHLAIPITNINLAYEFYVNILNCKVGRMAENWIDFNFFGHQLVGHLVEKSILTFSTNYVEDKLIPCRHFGVVLELNDWKDLVLIVRERGVKFLIKPQIRFKKKIGEQNIFFILDPFDNALEFKAFNDDDQIFLS